MRKRLDAKSRCCGATVVPYGGTHGFCYRCLATYDLRSRLQLENLFYVEQAAGHFVRREPEVAEREGV